MEHPLSEINLVPPERGKLADPERKNLRISRATFDRYLAAN
jgi:hypothetical protein